MDHAAPTGRSVNKLINETSPYLLQHATNPVNWYPWGDAAINLAREQDKPILLSIGYSACHWCHVMMHESFCDPDIASAMNRLFINIKIDKEERPDLDKIYQTAHQLLMGRPGGWPLTMFLSADTLIPYFGGTYFPKDVPTDAVGFEVLLHKLNDVYYHDREKIRQQEMHIRAIIAAIGMKRIPTELPLASTLRHNAELVLQKEFDPVHSGFGNEAKFPNCPSLEFLLRSPEPLMRHITLTTLKHMAQGGIYDQLAGGFFRYTVDPQWQIPHFEKMLYDNGQLLSLYAAAFQLTHVDEFKQIACETAEWLCNYMRDNSTGAFYTSMDADSEGEEGLYYVWEKSEIKNILDSNEYSLIKKYYQLDHKANFEDKWHLAINPQITEPARDQLKTIKQKLLQQRNLKTKPQIDKKILSSWNALVIKGLIQLGQILNEPQYINAAQSTLNFIREKMYIDRVLYASWQDGAPHIKGFLDDYAFLLDALLTLIKNDLEHEYIQFCEQLADNLLDYFYDYENGGFFFTANDAEKLFYRPKTFTDDATPSGNSIACISLLRLGKLLKRQDYIKAAKDSIYAAQVFINDAPEVHLGLLEAYTLSHQEA